MKRFVLSFALLFLFAPVVAQAACCKCLRPGIGTNTCLTDPTASCADILVKNGSNKTLSGFVCQTISETECQPVAVGGSALCQNGPIAASAYTEITPFPARELVTTITAPTLNVPIPGLKFTTNIPVYSDNPTAEIPFLSQYLVAIFNYFFGIVILTAAIMIVYGGFRYILSGTMSGITDGKKVINDAVIGLLLAFGTYTILQTLNPALTSLNPLKIGFVTQEGFKFGQSQMTTQVPTVSDAGVNTKDTSGGSIPGCPLTLTNPLILKNGNATEAGAYAMSLPENQKILNAAKMLSLNIVQDARAQEFFAKIIPLAKGKPFEERIRFIAEAAISCKVHLESCGFTAGTIWELSGVGDQRCFKERSQITGKDAKGNNVYASISCNPHENYFARPGAKVARTANITQITTNAQQSKINSLLCVNQCDAKLQNLPGCIADKKAARLSVIAELSKDPEWPDKWIKEIKPGDVIQVYTGNPSCGGGHSALFFGWTAGGGARVIQGEFGERVTAGVLCIRKACGDQMLPLVRVIKPIVAQ